MPYPTADLTAFMQAAAALGNRMDPGEVPATLTAAQVAAGAVGAAAIDAAGGVLKPDGSQASVSGDTVVSDLAALLALPAPAEYSRAIVLAPVIGTLSSGGVPGSRWIYIPGQGWRLRGRQALVFDTSAAVGAASTAEQVLGSQIVSDGLLPLLRLLDCGYMITRSGTTDAVTVRLRLGSALNTSGSEIASATNALSGTARSYVLRHQRIGQSVTHIRLAGTQWATDGLLGGATSSVLPSLLAISGLSGPLYLVITAACAGTTDTAALQQQLVWGE